MYVVEIIHQNISHWSVEDLPSKGRKKSLPVRLNANYHCENIRKKHLKLKCRNAVMGLVTKDYTEASWLKKPSCREYY